jgi:hypothetical protein
MIRRKIPICIVRESDLLLISSVMQFLFGSFIRQLMWQPELQSVYSSTIHIIHAFKDFSTPEYSKIKTLRQPYFWKAWRNVSFFQWACPIGLLNVLEKSKVFVYLFIYLWFVFWRRIASNDKMINELINWELFGRKWPWSNITCYPEIWMEVLSKMTKKNCDGIRSANTDMKPGSIQYEERQPLSRNVPWFKLIRSV